jgi:hypothetical protein
VDQESQEVRIRLREAPGNPQVRDVARLMGVATKLELEPNGKLTLSRTVGYPHDLAEVG